MEDEVSDLELADFAKSLTGGFLKWTEPELLDAIRTERRTWLLLYRVAKEMDSQPAAPDPIDLPDAAAP